MSRINKSRSLQFVKLAVIGLLVFSTAIVVANIDKVTHFFSSASPEPVKAFPSAEGFGANTTGGRFGKVILVTNLNDKGEGSLRACVEASGPRTCIFRTGGIINLTSALNITSPYLTVAGQTAPGGGITLKSNGSDIFDPNTHDIIIRYITARPGVGTSQNHASQLADNDASDIYNIIFDHCSLSWGIDSVWETWYRVYNSTIQWSFATEGLNCVAGVSKDGCHSKGIMIGGYSKGNSSSEKGSYNNSVHHNLMAHNGERNPLIQSCGTAQVINNITYNPLWTFSHQELKCVDPTAESNVNWIGNYHKQGPDSTKNKNLKVSVTGNSAKGHAYVANNLSRLKGSSTDTNWVVDAEGFLVNTPFDAPSITTTDAKTAFDQVLADGGNSRGIDCVGNWFNRRDPIDARIVNNVKNGTGKIINYPSDTPEKGWVNIDPGIACTDSDLDGLFDDWETRYFNSLSRGNVSTTTDDYDNDGYSDLEEFLNGTDPTDGAIIVTSPTPSLSPSPLPSVLPSPSPTPSPMPSPSPSPSRPSSPIPSPSPLLSPSPRPSIINNSYTLTPIADTSVKASSPNSNYGTKSTLYVDNNAEELVYLKFVIPTFVPSSLTRAILNLYVINPAGSSSTQYLSSVYDINWSERQMTYSNRPLLGDILAVSHGSNSKRYLQYDVIDYIRDNLGITISFAIHSPDDDGIDFSSRESYWQHPPQLVLELQP